jgi:hypothetical protein
VLAADIRARGAISRAGASRPYWPIAARWGVPHCPDPMTIQGSNLRLTVPNVSRGFRHGSALGIIMARARTAGLCRKPS